MVQPINFIHPQFSQCVCKLWKSLYGLKQAPHALYSRLSDCLLELGIVGSRSDSSLFILLMPQCTTYVLIYIDDILITISHPKGVDDLLHYLCEDFAIKDLGPLHFFLSMKVIPVIDGLIISQKCYMLDLFSSPPCSMLEAKHDKSPMSYAHSLSLFSEDLLIDPSSIVALFAHSNIYHLHTPTSPTL